MDEQRNSIIRRAVLEKLGEGLDFLFTADDVLTVAGISSSDFQEIEASIQDVSKRTASRINQQQP